MKSNHLLYITISLALCFGFVFAAFAQAPPPPPPPRVVPIDGGAILLAILGIGYGARKLYQREKSVS